MVSWYNFHYHIPSAMTQNKWNIVVHQNSNEKSAVMRAVTLHYRGGSEYPDEVEVWLKRRAGQGPQSKGKVTKIKRFYCRKKGEGNNGGGPTGIMYEVERLADVEACAT
jgi:hypothetical protein